jgi:hypothetical protein
MLFDNCQPEVFEQNISRFNCAGLALHNPAKSGLLKPRVLANSVSAFPARLYLFSYQFD